MTSAIDALTEIRAELSEYASVLVTKANDAAGEFDYRIWCRKKSEGLDLAIGAVDRKLREIGGAA